MCESTSESAEIADLGRKGTTTYELNRLNLLSLTVGFDQIDGSHDKDNRSNF